MRLLAAVTAMCLAGMSIAATAPKAEDIAKTVKIMPLGDSITAAPGCWRALLWKKLQDSGMNNTDFVGSQPGHKCGFDYDSENEGHSGFKATSIATKKQLPPWLKKAGPDIVMMHLGTNDMWRKGSPKKTIKAFSTLVKQMRKNNPNMVILVAQIIPMNPSDCKGCSKVARQLNRAIAKWAPTKSTKKSPITVVDCFTGFDTGKDTKDGVHPNKSGDKKLAECWFEPLSAAIKQVGGREEESRCKCEPEM
ncbi:hypothetical protein EMPG_11974 [Blastomyces silverae]|uniref:SGNH hydrolase-type esterase domain-containing protein n=1 Tax=Blastomyces silverae TaxID=2060906 RepID=A0A0H1BNE9_9EURO|nr:hypothetical protein EMPG_11974 [Blastomyces silverae]